VRPLINAEILTISFHRDTNENGQFDGLDVDPPTDYIRVGRFGTSQRLPFETPVYEVRPRLGSWIQNFETVDSAVRVSLASHTAPFFVVVHEGDLTAIGAVVGVSEVFPAGHEDGFLVSVNRPLVGGEFFWLALIADSNGNGQFDGPEVDRPVVHPLTGETVLSLMQITAPGEPHGPADPPPAYVLRSDPSPAYPVTVELGSASISAPATGNAGITAAGHPEPVGLPLAALALVLAIAALGRLSVPATDHSS
jgi:hypothetical protein